MKVIACGLLILSVFGFVLRSRLVVHSESEYHDAVRRERWGRALVLADRLSLIGHPTDEREHAELKRRVGQLEWTAERSPSVRARGVALAQLDRFAEAEAELRTIDSPSTTLLMAAVLQAQQRYSESDARYRQVIDSARPWWRVPPELPRVFGAATGMASALTLRSSVTERISQAFQDTQQAYDGLAYNARQQRRFRTAIAIYREALESLPLMAAYFHYQLGRTYAEADANREAIRAFERAAQLDPTTFQTLAQQRIEQLRLRASGCQF